MWRLLKFIFALPFIYIFVLQTLDFFYADYRVSDTLELSGRTYIHILIISIVVLQQIIYRISSEMDMLIKITKSTAYAVFFGFALIFYLYSIMPQTLFYINKAYTKELKDDLFEVGYSYERDGELEFNFYSNYKDLYFFTTNKIYKTNFNNIIEGDTVRVNYSIGLLNKPFLPSGKLEIIKE